MIKLLYKGEFYKEITKEEIDNLLKNQLKDHKLVLTKFVICVIYELLGLNIYGYVYGKEFINNKDHFVIILREDDYKMLIREEKISDLLNNK